MSAMQYAYSLAEEYGMPVFPCGPDKKPYTTHGFKDASLNGDQLEEWWREWPDALVGIPTGAASHLLVVDVDPHGETWYAEHATELDAKRVHKTKRGHHLLYRMPKLDIRNSAGQLAPGIDVRGEGGYIIWWPAHGMPAVGDLEDLAEPPPWLLDRLVRPKPNGAQAGNGAKQGQGNRNSTLTALAGSMRRAGFSSAAILDALHKENFQRFEPPLPGQEVNVIAAQAEKWERGEVEARENTPEKRVITLRPIHEIVAEAREPEWLIHKVIERRVLAVIAGPRGTFKSFVALDWSMRMAIAGHPGVILSGEGGGLDRRITAWKRTHQPDLELSVVPLVALERPLNLTLLAELGALSEAIESLREAPEFIVIDTLSKFSTGMDENDNGEMASFLSNLSACLREDLDCTVLLVAHSGHGEVQRPRGASSLMSNPDAEYIVSRPDPRGMTVTVSRERFKDTAALPALAYEARVVDLGRVDSYGEPITSLALITSDTPAPPNMKGRGKNQEKVLVALREWYRVQPAATHISSIDIRELCKAQGVGHKRQPEVLNSFVNSRILTPSVGGYVFHGENL